MRKLTAICFAVLIATTAFAAPQNESKDRSTPNPVTRIVQQIKKIVVHIFDDPTINVPTPTTPTP